MSSWFWYAVAAAILYGAHQIFTRLASERIGDGLGGFIVEASAALSILIYLAILWLSGRWSQKFSGAGFNYSLLTEVCVGAGDRSEEHTSELQSRFDLVCRLLLEKKKNLC